MAAVRKRLALALAVLTVLGIASLPAGAVSPITPANRPTPLAERGERRGPAVAPRERRPELHRRARSRTELDAHLHDGASGAGRPRRRGVLSHARQRGEVREPGEPTRRQSRVRRERRNRAERQTRRPLDARLGQGRRSHRLRRLADFQLERLRVHEAGRGLTSDGTIPRSPNRAAAAAPSRGTGSGSATAARCTRRRCAATPSRCCRAPTTGATRP